MQTLTITDSYDMCFSSLSRLPTHPWCPHAHHWSHTSPGSSWTGRELDRCSRSPRSKPGILAGSSCVRSPSSLDRQGIGQLTVPIHALLLLVVLCCFHSWSTTLTYKCGTLQFWSAGLTERANKCMHAQGFIRLRGPGLVGDPAITRLQIPACALMVRAVRVELGVEQWGGEMWTWTGT